MKNKLEGTENSNGLFVTDQEELEQISWNELRKVSQ